MYRFFILLLLVSTSISGQKKLPYLKVAEQFAATNTFKSIEAAKEVYTWSFKTNDHYHICLSSLFIAKAYRKLGYYHIATQYDSIAVLHAKEQQNVLLQQKAINNYVRNFVEALQLAKAEKLLINYQQLFAGKYTSETCVWYEMKAMCWFNKMRFDSAITICHTAVALTQQVHDTTAGMHLQMLLGKFYAMKLQPDSVRLVYDALRYFEKKKEYPYAAQAAGIIGLVLASLNNTDEALFYYRKQLNLYKAGKNEQEAMQALLNMGDAYLVKKEIDSAKQALYTGFQFYRKTNFQKGIAAVCVRLAKLYISTGQYDSAMVCLKITEQINSTLQLTAINIITNGLQFDLQSKIKNYAEANAFAEAAIKGWINNKDEDLTEGMYQRLQEEQYLTPTERKQSNRLVVRPSPKNRADQKQEVHADPEYEKLRSLNWNTGGSNSKDSTYFEEKNERILRIDKEYKTDLLTDTIRKTRYEVAVTNKSLRTSRMIILLSVFMLAVVAGGLWLQYKNRRRAERDRATIEELQKEIHHRVTNNLGVINAMVEMAGKATEYQMPMAALKTRIDSIALVHKLLYSGKAITGKISLQPYFEALSEAIAAIFETDKPVKIRIDALVETDSVVAEKIGLIVNELITNSFKYAFEGKEAGTIHLYASIDKGQLYLTVSDDGKGLPNDMKKGHGSRLIKGLCHQLKGRYNYQNGNGTFFEMTVPV